MGFFATVVIRLIEVVFVVGAIGSLIVIILSTVEDARMLRNKD